MVLLYEKYDWCGGMGGRGEELAVQRVSALRAGDKPRPVSSFRPTEDPGFLKLAARRGGVG